MKPRTRRRGFTLLALLAPLSFASSPLPAAPARQAAPATTQPGATRPATAPAADDAGVAAVLGEFLQAVTAGEHDRAYALTTAGFRAAHTLEAFKKDMDRLRADANLRLPLQLVAAPRTKDGQAPQAAAASPRLTARTDRRAVRVGLRFTFEDGLWRVASAELLEAKEGERFLNEFQRANPGAKMVGLAGAGRTSVQARVTRLDEKSITVEPARTGGRAEPPAARTLAIDENTKVFVAVAQGERKTPTGQVVRSFRSVPGRLADVKVGQQVTVDTPPGEERATRITVSPVPSEPGPGL